MNHTTSKSAQQAGNAVVAKAKQKAAAPWVQRLEQLGFLVRGLIYIVIGLLALKLAIGAGGATTSPTSAILLMGRQPFGKLLLAVIALGLAGYSLWGFIRAILDPLRRGTDSDGLIDRAGFLFSGISYAGLLVPTVLTLLNKPGASTQASATGVPATLMTGPWGKWLVIAFGLFWIGAGFGQWAEAYTARFLRDLKTGMMSTQETKTAKLLGQVGYAARGVVFVLIGLIVVKTVFAAGAAQPQGFNDALAALARAPYGFILLGAVASGLILFGIYSAMCAKWNKIVGRS